MFRKTLLSLFVALSVSGTVAGLALSTSAVATAALPCRGTWDVVVGGLTDNDSAGFVNADQHVGYNSFDTRSGVNELNRLVRDHARVCPGDFIHPVGFSGGAAVVHLWATENGRDFLGKASIVLIGDPKRSTGRDGRGFAVAEVAWVPALGGANSDYGGLPALQVCNRGDHICNKEASWDGYFRGVHGDYNFDVSAYANNAQGQVYR